MKNKKLLTIIGIALLLIVGISGTFAYYSVVSNSTGGTGTVSAKSDEVGNVSLSGDGGSLHINLTPSDVSNVAGGVFYGTASDNGYSNVEEKLDVAKIEATSAPVNIKYTCTFDIKVKPESGSLTGVTAGEILFSTISVDIDGVTTDKLAFSTLTEEKTYHASTTLYSGDINYLRVSARITSSSTDGNESWLSNINGAFSVSSDNLKCTASKEETVTEENNYTISGKMTDENGNALTGYAVLMSTPRVITLESDGTFEIENVEPGIHSLYYMDETNPGSLTASEIKSQAKSETTFKTSVAREKDNLKLENRSKIINLSILEKKI